MDKFVLCSEHHKLRPERYLIKRDVLNAAGDVVGVAYRCRPDDSCDKRAAERFQSNQQAAMQATESTSEAMKLYGGREVRGRYYDLANHDGGIDNEQRKVCFSCGLSDHERSTCPNLYCRVCHTNVLPNDPSHVCQPVTTLSDFIDMRVPTDAELKNVRCSICNGIGHLDCVPPKHVAHVVSCAACGSQGHHAFQCINAPHDRWIEKQIDLLQAALTKRQRDPVVPRAAALASSSNAAKPLKEHKHKEHKHKDHKFTTHAPAPTPAPAVAPSTSSGRAKRVVTAVSDDEVLPVPPSKKGPMVEDRETRTAVAPPPPPPPPSAFTNVEDVREASPSASKKKKANKPHPVVDSPQSTSAPEEQIFTF